MPEYVSIYDKPQKSRGRPRKYATLHDLIEAKRLMSMATTDTQTFNPSFSNPDDMPEYVSVYDKPKTRKLSDEQKRERLRINYKIYYLADPERERARKKTRELTEERRNKKKLEKKQKQINFRRNKKKL